MTPEQARETRALPKPQLKMPDTRFQVSPIDLATGERTDALTHRPTVAPTHRSLARVRILFLLEVFDLVDAECEALVLARHLAANPLQSTENALSHDHSLA